MRKDVVSQGKILTGTDNDRLLFGWQNWCWIGIGICECDCCCCCVWACLWLELWELFVELDDELLILLIEQTLDLRELNEPGEDGGV
jgi:hypothetical protein